MRLKSKKLRFLTLMFVAVLVISVVGCSKEDKPNVDEGAADVGSIVIKFGHNQPIASPEHVGAEKFKESVESLDPRIKVEIYPASQLGSLRAQVEGTQMGAVNMTMQPASVITPFVDDIKLIDLPYLLPRDSEKVFEFLDSDLAQESLDRLEEGQFKGLGYWFGGYKLFTTKDKEIHMPTDFKGLKMRTMESPLLLSQFKAWGATPIPLPYAELYTALQQGIVDGNEQPIQTIYLNKFHEVQGNIIQSYHGTMMYVIIANKAWFDGLDETAQAAIIQAEKDGRVAERTAYAASEADYIAKIKDSGVNFYTLTDEEIAAFKEASKPVYEEHVTTEWQKEYIKKVQAFFEE